ncbi:MAG: tetratricopeptide repeat protein [Bacteriovoracaceae bacterium]|nr:tetratricopeptide repeat protein [Bacteriovoracaceae bacterium]
MSVKDLVSHYRLSIQVAEDLVQIEREGKVLNIKIQDTQKAQQIYQEISKIKLSKRYFDQTEVKLNNDTIKIAFVDNNIEMFDFYKKNSNELIMDFWGGLEEEKSVSLIQSAVQKNTVIHTEKKPAEKKPIKIKDFSYGAVFMGEIEALFPLESAKTVVSSPDEFYPFKKFLAVENSEQDHINIMISFYYEQKWDLVQRSMVTFEQKYKNGQHKDIFLFLKSSALIKQNIQEKEEIKKTAMAYLKQAIEKSHSYTLKRAGFLYLMSVYWNLSDSVNLFKTSQDFYKEAKRNASREDQQESLMYLISSMLKLDKYKEVLTLLSEESIREQIPFQKLLAFEVYAHYQQKDYAWVIENFERYKYTMQKPWETSLLFNTAESYFSLKKYSQALPLWKDFLDSYSTHSFSSVAKLRLALTYEQDEIGQYSLAQEIYSELSRNSNIKISYEAKLRNVSLQVIRSSHPAFSDDYLNISTEDKKNLNSDLKELLWLVRLRSFLSKERYESATEYAKVIPFSKISPERRPIFEQDIKSAVLGLAQMYFNQGEFQKIVDLSKTYFFTDSWLFKHYLLFSYVKLNDFEKAHFEQSKLSQFTHWHESDRWVEFPTSFFKAQESLIPFEIEIRKALGAQDLFSAKKVLLQMKKIAVSSELINYYEALLYFQERNYAQAESFLEKTLNQKDTLKRLSKEDRIQVGIFYSVSLYHQQKYEKFRKVTTPLCLYSHSKHLEELHYLLIENYAQEKKQDENFEKIILKYRANFENSRYTSRVTYLLGRSLIESERKKEGAEILTRLVGNTEVPDDVREEANLKLLTLKIENL